MNNRIIDISEGGYYLRVENRQLVLERKDESPKTIPMSDIAILAVGNSWVTYSHSVITLLAETGGVAVFGGADGVPVAMSLPLFGHTLQSQRLREQIAASEPTNKRLWKSIIEAKITNQGLLLKHLRKNDYGLVAKAKLVKSGDSSNLEAQAARIYWRKIFDDPSFRRTPGEGERPNHFLDYGYAILRGIVARAVCASGLNPTLGVHHHHRDNSFCLADDIMEPFRPLVDHAVTRLVGEGYRSADLNRETKQVLVSALLSKITFNNEARTIFDVVASISASLASVFSGRSKELTLPDPFLFH